LKKAQQDNVCKTELLLYKKSLENTFRGVTQSNTSLRRQAWITSLIGQGAVWAADSSVWIRAWKKTSKLRY